MKKILAIVLSLIMIVSLAAPAFAVGSSDFRGAIPVVLITGDGDPIYDSEGNRIYSADDLYSSIGSGDSDSSAALEAAANILMPMLLEGVLLDKWDDYYNAVYKEISDIYSEVILDGNGNPQYGTDISQKHREENIRSMTTDRKNKQGTYSFADYHFWYDWRLDPIKIADELNEYIEAVKSVTNHDKICVVTRCVGHSVLLAYIAKYGTDSLYGVGVDGTTSNGSEFVSGALSGDFAIEGDSIARFIEDADYYDVFHLDSFLTSTILLLENSGALDRLTDTGRKLIYLKIEKGIISAIARATMFTMPCYWALVSEDKYETAKEYVFGKEGDEKRTEYAGLIEKLDNYNEVVRNNIDEIMLSIPESGANFCLVSKYGSQIVPIVKDADYVSDQYVSVVRSSFGATTSKLGETLSDEYIAERTAEGKGGYISPDKQIDASTCLFPDYTYFVKGVRHSDWSKVENNIIMRTIQGETQLTVRDLEYSQFVVTYPSSDEWAVMTEENCNTEVWTDDSTAGKPKTKWERLKLFIDSMVNWLKLFFAKITSLLEK